MPSPSCEWEPAFLAAPSEPTAPDRERRRKVRVGIICAFTFVSMIGAAYAAVPLYRAFCQLTGFDGTIRRADTAPDTVLGKTLTVRFDANTRDLPWTFTAMQTSQTVRIGETKLAFFKVTNNANSVEIVGISGPRIRKTS